MRSEKERLASLNEAVMHVLSEGNYGERLDQLNKGLKGKYSKKEIDHITNDAHSIIQRHYKSKQIRNLMGNSDNGEMSIDDAHAKAVADYNASRKK